MSISQTITGSERQQAPRHKINLEKSFPATAVKTLGSAGEVYYSLQAQLLDVSLSGFALSISAADAWELQQMGRD